MWDQSIRLINKGYTPVELLTTDKSRASAHRFYERLGFAATHEGMKLILVPEQVPGRTLNDRYPERKMR